MGIRSEKDRSGAAGRRSTVAFITLGCAKNEVDSDRMRARLEAAGHTVIDDTSRADVVVVNTCSFLTMATEEGIDTIFDVLSDEGFKSHGGKVVVTGCMPSRYGKDLSDELTEVASFVPVKDEDGIVRVIEGLEPGCDEKSGLKDATFGEERLGAVRTETGPSAYVKISDGCDRWCSFCAIPAIRGPYESRTAEDIAFEVGGLVSSGVREIVLIGQDTGVWGTDLPGKPTLATLLGSLAKRFDRTWFRVLYLQPEGITDELLDTVRSHPNITRYFDIPVQHASARIVRDMNRAGDAKAYLETVGKIRARVPGAALRTTVMAGFPGETDDEFDELVEFLDDARFDYTGVFAYSQEDGTTAGDRDDQVDEDVREDRAERLRDVADRIGFERASSHVGETVDVLVEAYDPDEPGSVVGRTYFQAPEVDGQVHIADPVRADGTLLAPGDIVTVRITDSYFYDLEGEVER
jgi:ribosomal protein S12 methylthiotransferase